ncbi:hypothetical protein [Polluticaenibacter yanchengensis]|uniref:UDP-glycosyltransferase n=1 Tax=Polluticaenibacter yanchengensis TaxID=3014562 RepID=A0ABT4UPF1_9BACT|nr:hypothetical protein [Chitinophagaceae bacterium LY-5]
MRTIGILLPDGVGIKNYLYSNLLEELNKREQVNVVIFHSSELSNVKSLVNFDKFNVSYIPFRNYREDFKSRFLRESVAYARLKHFTEKLNNPTILKTKTIASKFTKKAFLKSVQLFAGTIYKDYNKILKLEAKYQKHLAQCDFSFYENLLTENKIDLIISLHQRPIINIPFYEAAKRLSVKRISVIYSWDNIAKAKLYSLADKYLLWSSFMKNQMNLFYPEIPNDKLIITGTPQFNFYRNSKFVLPKQEFCNKFKLDINKSKILFTGSDYRTSPYDDLLLISTAEAILKLPEEKRPELIFRRSPADTSGRHNYVLSKYPWIVSIDPIWVNNGNNWGGAVPTFDDISNITNVVNNVNVIINVSSTMALDGAILDKPCIYLAFTPQKGLDEGFDYARDIHSEDHFKEMKKMNAVQYIYDEKDYSESIINIIESPEKYCTGKHDFLHLITNSIITEAESNIANVIINSLNEKTA